MTAYFSNLRRLMLDRYTGFYIASNLPLESIEGLYIYEQPTPSALWILKHNFSNPNYIIAIYGLNSDGTYNKQYPNIIQSDDTTINLDFNGTTVAGYACVLFAENDMVIPTSTPAITPTITPSPTPTNTATVTPTPTITPTASLPAIDCIWYDVTNFLFGNHGTYRYNNDDTWVNDTLDCCILNDPNIINNNGFSAITFTFPSILLIRITVDNTHAPILNMTPNLAAYSSEIVGNNIIYSFNSINTPIFLTNAWLADYISGSDIAFATIVKIEICTTSPPSPPA